MITRVLVGAIGAGMLLTAAPAIAGEWRLNDRACQDLYQDRNDDRWGDRRSDDNGRYRDSNGRWVDGDADNNGRYQDSSGRWIDRDANNNRRYQDSSGRWIQLEAGSNARYQDSNGRWVDGDADNNGRYQDSSGRWINRDADNNGARDRVDDRPDRRNGRRDRSITICPINAFYYVPTRAEQRRGQYARIEHRHDGYARSRSAERPPLQYDRKLKMNYRYDDGRKIYVRLDTSRDDRRNRP